MQKPQNILVRDGKWMITDLGIAHSKNKTPTDDSKTGKHRVGSDEFGGPEDRVSRKYDIWGIGCVGCILLAWLMGGSIGVEAFRRNRRHRERDITVVYNFYCVESKGLQPAVDSLLSRVANMDGYSKKVAPILRRMLSYDPDGRPTARQAGEDFKEALRLETFAASTQPATRRLNLSRYRQRTGVDPALHLEPASMDSQHHPIRDIQTTTFLRFLKQKFPLSEKLKIQVRSRQRTIAIELSADLDIGT